LGFVWLGAICSAVDDSILMVDTNQMLLLGVVYFVLLLRKTIANDFVVISHCQIKTSHIFLPLVNNSIPTTVQLVSSSKHKLIDCARACLASILCQTAVLNEDISNCTLFQQTAGITGNTVAVYNRSFTTIMVENRPCKTID
jgi:hypothetical protein